LKDESNKNKEREKRILRERNKKYFKEFQRISKNFKEFKRKIINRKKDK
jgi:hypothetical protein